MMLIHLALLAPLVAALSFSNSTKAIWAPAQLSASFVLLRPPTLQLGSAPSRMRALVSAAQDNADQQKVLALYRLFVNGVAVTMGPGRGVLPVSMLSTEAVFDIIEVPAAALQASPDGTSMSVALQCFQPNGGAGAWVMLEAEFFDSTGHSLATLQTNDSDWLTYNADSIFKKGSLDTGSGHGYVNEDIDARAFVNISDWRLPHFQPSLRSWSAAEVRTPSSQPVPKTTLPLAIQTDIQPTELLQLSNNHYFFDFGQERTGGVTLRVPAETVQAWGGAGIQVEVRLAEQLGHFDKHSVLRPGLPFDPGNWNKIPNYVSQFTLAEGYNLFEQHEYVGVWRYGEILVKHDQAHNASKNFSLTQWSVAYPWEDEAYFQSDNAMLNKIWNLCYNTIKYNALDTFTDSNVRERLPYAADGFLASRSYWALRSDRAWPRHSIQHVLHNPTWPTEWKQYTILMVHEHYMQSGDISLADDNFDLLVNNTMLPYISPSSQLVNFTDTLAEPTGHWIGPIFVGNSPLCHIDTGTFPPGVQDGGRSCDNIDWLPKFRAGFQFSPVNTIINAFAVRSMTLLAELANATGRQHWAQKLSVQANLTKTAMLKQMYRVDGMWCDGVCSSTPAATFHSQHFPMFLSITPEYGIPAALKYLQQKGLVGSTYSSHSLIHGLYDQASSLDYGQTALDLMTQCSDHSWCHMLQLGATTTWEHWYPHDGTHSHPWSSTPASAIVAGLMGIRPVVPGWHQWIARPAPGNLTFLNITVPTPAGNIKASFTKTKSSTEFHVSVPVTTEAILCLPLYGVAASQGILTVDGKPHQGRHDDSTVRSGAYVCSDSVRGGNHTLVWRPRTVVVI
eukprot:TRINITY_DN105414_c0_g1_i1.p1 TRINITY_DN105414_c0_g1~~TRINITY_DN105414_c0_g1_i1.p1  ORF type:complete len:845 (-),score=124.72 TRINITY_DN105414_c0_g1_i1:52-2586(-)